MVYLGVIAAALSSAVGASAVTRGPLAGHGSGAWKITCGITAVLSACAALAAGLNQQMGLADRLARATACAGRLHALEVEIALRGRAPDDVAHQYQELLATYEEFMA